MAITCRDTNNDDRLALASVSLERIASLWEECREKILNDPTPATSIWKMKPLLKEFRTTLLASLNGFLASDASAFRGCHVHRIRPPVKAHGGKYYLAPKIVPILLGVRAKVTEYLEPCAFGASVFLAMPRMKREILGDINPDVVALWTVLSKKESAAELSQ